MGEKHQKYVMTTSGYDEAMYALYTFVSSSGQNAVRFVNNSTAQAVSSSLGKGGLPVTANFVSGSFIVVEPVNAMPSGYRWQARISRSTTDQRYNLSTIGGWDINSGSFLAVSGVTPPVTGEVVWNSNADALAINNQWLFSSSDLDTYGASSTPATYFRAVRWIPTNVEGSQFGVSSFHIGGYIPTNVSANTNPVVALGGKPFIFNGASNWGYSTADGNNRNRCNPDYNYSTTVLASSYAYTPDLGLSTYAKDVNGQWVNTPAFVNSVTAAAAMGYFGKYAFLIGNSGRADGQQDAAQEYMVVNDVMIRWKP